MPGWRRRGGLMMPSLNWHDLESFETGAFYRHMDSGETVQFVGVASMPELDGEDVGVFRFAEGGRCLIATRQRRPNGASLSKGKSHEIQGDGHSGDESSAGKAR